MTLPVLDAPLLSKARAHSALSKGSLVEELEDLSGSEPRMAVRALAQPFGLAVLETAVLLAFRQWLGSITP